MGVAAADRIANLGVTAAGAQDQNLVIFINGAVFCSAGTFVRCDGSSCCVRGSAGCCEQGFCRNITGFGSPQTGRIGHLAVVGVDIVDRHFIGSVDPSITNGKTGIGIDPCIGTGYGIGLLCGSLRRYRDGHQQQQSSHHKQIAEKMRGLNSGLHRAFSPSFIVPGSARRRPVWCVLF